MRVGGHHTIGVGSQPKGGVVPTVTHVVDCAFAIRCNQRVSPIGARANAPRVLRRKGDLGAEVAVRAHYTSTTDGLVVVAREAEPRQWLLALADAGGIPVRDGHVPFHVVGVGRHVGVGVDGAGRAGLRVVAGAVCSRLAGQALSVCPKDRIARFAGTALVCVDGGGAASAGRASIAVPRVAHATVVTAGFAYRPHRCGGLAIRAGSTRGD